MSMPVAVVNLTVARVEERKRRSYVSGYGDTAVFEEESLGWFVIVDGGLAIKVSEGSAPAIAPGDRLRLILERMTARDEPAAAPAGPAATDRRAAARLQGYEGGACGECANFTLVRNGTCLKCDTCGATTGCS